MAALAAVLGGSGLWQLLHAGITLAAGDDGAVGVKLCSTLHVMVVVQGTVRSLLDAEAALLTDPIFGASPMATFYFCVAASYYLWAALSCGHAAVQQMRTPVSTADSEGSPPCYSMVLLHHCTCFVCYYYSATLPFMQYPAHFFLFSELSTILLVRHSPLFRLWQLRKELITPLATVAVATRFRMHGGSWPNRSTRKSADNNQSPADGPP